jgi:uncharacterized protein YjbI with pentapeptide repeats
MANPQILDLLKQGVDTWNMWRRERLDIWPELVEAHLEGADLIAAELEGADLSGVHLDRADLFGAYLERADLSKAYLVETILFGANMGRANLSGAYLEWANLSGAYLKMANLSGAHLEGAILVGAHLEGAILVGAHLERADLSGAYLGGANLRQAIFDNATRLDGIILNSTKYGTASLADVSWGSVNLGGVDWASVKMLGDEREAHHPKKHGGRMQDKAAHISQYRAAVRANRQLAVVLQSQGLNEEADRFAHRAQVLQRAVWRYQRRVLKYLFSWFLYLQSGYGYKPIRSLFTYLLVLGIFAVIYHMLTPVKLHLTWLGALIFSVTSFHGRGFFPSGFSSDDPVTILAVVEAIIGLLLEINFIATFRQLFFGK